MPFCSLTCLPQWAPDLHIDTGCYCIYSRRHEKLLILDPRASVLQENAFPQGSGAVFRIIQSQ